MKSGQAGIKIREQDLVRRDILAATVCKNDIYPLGKIALVCPECFPEKPSGSIPAYCPKLPFVCAEPGSYDLGIHRTAALSHTLAASQYVDRSVTPGSKLAAPVHP